MKFAILFLVLFSFLGAKELNLYALDSYFSKEILDEFENESGIKVNLSTFKDNFEMYSKLRMTYDANYDLITPASYMILALRDRGLLRKLDKKRINNLDKIMINYTNQAFDLHQEYSIPLTARIMGLLYNKLALGDLNINSWSDLFDVKFKDKILLLNEPDKMLQISLMSLGYLRNTRDNDEIKKAYDNLLSILKSAKFINIDTKLPLKERVSVRYMKDIALATMWINEAFVMKKEDANLEFIFPKENGAIWIDYLAITSNAKNVDNAYKFINFTLRPDISIKISQHSGFNSVLNFDFIKTSVRKKEYEDIVFLSSKEAGPIELQVDIRKVIKTYVDLLTSLKLAFDKEMRRALIIF